MNLASIFALIHPSASKPLLDLKGHYNHEIGEWIIAKVCSSDGVGLIVTIVVDSVGLEKDPPSSSLSFPVCTDAL